MRSITACLILLSISFSPRGFSQQPSAASASLHIPDSNRVDTNYVKSYKDRLIIALWQSNRKFDITIDQKMDSSAHLTAINYVANSNNVSGISIDYDIIGFAFGYRSIPNKDPRVGNSDYMDLGLNINTRRLRFENSFKRYSGFYDVNSKNYTPNFDSTTHYYKNPYMSLRVVKSKLLYTFNKRRFSLSAPYANVKRQVKSSSSWVIVGNFYGLSLFSDSSIIPPPLRPSYGPIWDGFQRMNVYGYSAVFGGTFTLVMFKRFYLNCLGTFGPETQFRHYYISPESVHYKYWKYWFASDLRFSWGYNGKKFFMRVSGIFDINNFDSKAMDFRTTFYAGSFDIGYRFRFKAPKPYQKFQQTKLYKML